MALPPSLVDRLLEPAPILLDGATGGALEDRGVDTKNPLWGSIALTSEGGRDLNRKLHADYVEAGAEIVIANTHNLGQAHCAAYAEGLAEAAPSLAGLQLMLHEAALEDARASGARWVAGCLASPDRPYATRATLGPEAVAAALSAQARIVEGLGFDLAVFEMLTTESDVRGVARLPWSGPARGAGLVLGPGGALLDGFDLGEAVRILAGAGVELVFVQCTRYTLVESGLPGLLAAASSVGVVPGVYANDGRSWSGGAWCGPRVSPDAYAACASRWVAAGARLVGGCCGTGPEHIRALNRLRGM